MTAMKSLRSWRWPTVAVMLAVATALLIPTLATALPARSSAQQVKSSWNWPGPKPTIVLVHGAWADSSGWDGVIQYLQAKGFTVDAPPNPLEGLSSDSAFLTSYLKTISRPIVLAGHSYGGAVITNAAVGNTNVKALVYVDAFEPAKGETLEQLTFAMPGSCLEGGGDLSNVFNFAVDPSLPSGDYDLYLKTAPGTD
jgi:pimeloyl-ACP methyl ester carboxylesterase